MLDYELIIKYFLNTNYDVQPIEMEGDDALSVSFEMDKKTVTLVHVCTDELTALPTFFLKDFRSFGVIAHVLPIDSNIDLGWICVNELDSVSINFDRPELAFEESINRHIKQLTKLLSDPEFNKQELLREFHTNWYKNTISITNQSIKTLYCVSGKGGLEQLDMYKPLISDSIMSIAASPIALSKNNKDIHVSKYLKSDNRDKYKDTIACVIPLIAVNPIIPSDADGLKVWLLDTLNNVEESSKLHLTQKVFNYKSKQFWLVFNVSTPSGVSWFGVKLNQNKKRAFPQDLKKLADWKIEPILVNVFNKDLLMPRSGANTSLDTSKVLLVGCGSVGSELAFKLGAAGVGHLDIIDPDSFSISNMYRHTLNREHILWPKSTAVAIQLRKQFPWINVKDYERRLLDMRKQEILDSYNLVVIAIGAPTHERLFHEYLTKNRINISVIYTWLEGYGVGGHAVLDVPQQKGCLRCAYVEPDSGKRGLASNLNFLISDQHIVKNYAGCGEMFIPYGAVSSTQTALIAADLAINYLSGKLTTPTKVSWKGDSFDAEQEGLKFTSRYDYFDYSLTKQPLHHPLCDVCSDNDYLIYKYNSYQLGIPTHILKQLDSFKQIGNELPESAGLIIGYKTNNSEYRVEKITTPKSNDYQTRSYFKLDASAHQCEVNEAYKNSDCLLGYMGTWHTHPQNVPVPSSVDITDWKKHNAENSDRQLFFVVVGLKKLAVFIIHDDKLIELTPVIYNKKEFDDVGKV